MSRVYDMLTNNFQLRNAFALISLSRAIINDTLNTKYEWITEEKKNKIQSRADVRPISK